MERNMATATARYTQTSGYRYNVSRNGRVCCRSNDIKTLCASCRKQAEECQCETCKQERAAHSKPTMRPASTPSQTRVQGTPPAAPRAAARQEVPAAPKVSALIRQQRGIEPEAIAAHLES